MREVGGNASELVLASRTPCPGLFCSPDQVSEELPVDLRQRFVIELIHGHLGGPAHLLLAATADANETR